MIITEEFIEYVTLQVDVPYNETTLDFRDVGCMEIASIQINMGHKKCVFKNFDSLKGMNLNSINIVEGKVDDISFMSEIERVDVINFSHNNISDISPLKNVKCNILWLYSNLITDISCIKEFKYKDIHKISLLQNRITDLSPLMFINVEELRAGFDNKYDITGIINHPTLKTLNNEIFKDKVYEYKLNKLIDHI